MNLIFQFHAWFLLFCLLTGLLYSAVLYYKGKTFKDASLSFKKNLFLLALARFISVSLIAFFLLSPLIKSRHTKVEKPILVIAQDNSESIGNYFSEKDSTEFTVKINGLVKSLGNKFSVQSISFGDKIKNEPDFRFNEKSTDISAAISYIENSFSNRNLGAVILVSDGIFNQGSNPLYSGKKLTVPIYSIALGDTVEKKDLILSKMNYNRIVYLGDKFGIKADIIAKNCNGEKTNLSVSIAETKKFVPLQRKNISIKGDAYDTSVVIILDADKSGIQHYRISLEEVEGEITSANNVQDIFVEVLDGRQKILLIANSPHPDIAALKDAIGKNKNYEVKTEYADKLANSFSFKEFNLVILHQLPSKTQNLKNIYPKIMEQNLPVLFVIGSQTSITQFNNIQSFLQIQSRNINTNEVQAVPQNDFTYFSLSNEVQQKIKNLPPLIVPYGEYKMIPNSQSLLTQKIGSVETKTPLLFFSQDIGSKTGILCGEGFWKWRLHDYMLNKNQDATDELISRTVQYLSVKEDKRPFRVILLKNNFEENEPVTMDAELYDESYRLSNIPDVELKIVNEDGKEFPFIFNKNENSYSLNAGFFPAGNYVFSARTKFNNKELFAKGQFSVSSIGLEALRFTANHQLLYQMSAQSGGEVYSASELNRLAEKILSDDSIKPVSYSTYKSDSMINLKWIFFLILALLSLEWFVRKWNGAY